MRENRFRRFRGLKPTTIAGAAALGLIVGGSALDSDTPAPIVICIISMIILLLVKPSLQRELEEMEEEEEEEEVRAHDSKRAA